MHDPQDQGYYSRQTNQIVTYDPEARVRYKEESWLYGSATIIHEAAHQSAFNLGLHNRLAPPPNGFPKGWPVCLRPAEFNHASKFTEQTDRVSVRYLKALQKYYSKTGRFPADWHKLLSRMPISIRSLNLLMPWPGALLFTCQKTIPRHILSTCKKTLPEKTFQRIHAINDSKTSRLRLVRMLINLRRKCAIGCWAKSKSSSVVPTESEFTAETAVPQIPYVLARICKMSPSCTTYSLCSFRIKFCALTSRSLPHRNRSSHDIVSARTKPRAKSV